MPLHGYACGCGAIATLTTRRSLRSCLPRFARGREPVPSFAGQLPLGPRRRREVADATMQAATQLASGSPTTGWPSQRRPEGVTCQACPTFALDSLHYWLHSCNVYEMCDNETGWQSAAASQLQVPLLLRAAEHEGRELPPLLLQLHQAGGQVPSGEERHTCACEGATGVHRRALLQQTNIKTG